MAEKKPLFHYLLVNYPEAFEYKGAMPPDIHLKASAEEVEQYARRIWDAEYEDGDPGDDYDPPSLSHLIIYKDGSFDVREFDFPVPDFENESEDEDTV